MWFWGGNKAALFNLWGELGGHCVSGQGKEVPLSFCLIFFGKPQDCSAWKSHRIVHFGKTLQAQHLPLSRVSKCHIHTLDHFRTKPDGAATTFFPGLDHCPSADIFTKISWNLPSLRPFPLSVVPQDRLSLWEVTTTSRNKGERYTNKTFPLPELPVENGTMLKNLHKTTAGAGTWFLDHLY